MQLTGEFKKNNTGIFPYNRAVAYNYAKKWAFDRNPKYYNFDFIGGDCTNFASQVLYAGGCKMNYEKWMGWYYNNVNNRAPSWTGVDHLYEFLVNNQGSGPIAKLSNINEVEIGDIVQLNFGSTEKFDHSPVIVRIEEPRKQENIFIATHTYDRFDYPLSNYYCEEVRFIHILGYRR